MQNPKQVFSIIGSLALIASIVMFVVGSNSGHLTELKDFFWIPLILSAVSFMAANKK